jgi:hypothetical protein
MILLCHVSQRLSTCVHYNIAIRLFKSHENIHHLKLPLYHQAAVTEDGHGGMIALQDGIGIMSDLYLSDKVRGIRLGESESQLFILSARFRWRSIGLLWRQWSSDNATF